MRSEFEKWFLSTPTGKALSTPNLGYYIFERHLDEYRDRDVEMAHIAYVCQQSKVDELQKRVDKAIRLLVEAELYQSEPNIDLAVQALKGENNEF